MTTAHEVFGSVEGMPQATTPERENRSRVANILRDVAGWAERGLLDSIAFQWKNSDEIDISIRLKATDPFKTSTEEPK